MDEWSILIELLDVFLSAEMSGLFRMNSMRVKAQRARNTNANAKKNQASGELGIANPTLGCFWECSILLQKIIWCNEEKEKQQEIQHNY